MNHATASVDLAELVRHDSKYNKLIEFLLGFFAEHPREKVVVFSTFRATLQYLGERLEEDGVNCVVLMGGQRESKADVIDRFRNVAGPSVLLSSEVGGEGVDLQFSWVVVNYDLPWNPMRIEQRIGRIDRIGQISDKVTIVNIVYEDTIDSRIYTRLYEKLDLCRNALGDFDAILGKTIRGLEGELISKRLTAEEQIERIDRAALALQMKRRDEERLEENAASLTAYGDFILNHIRQARELHRWITGTDLVRYVSDYLRLHYPGSALRQPGDDSCVLDVRLSAAARTDLEAYVRKKHLRYDGLLTSPSGKRTRCRFDNSVVQTAGRTGEETISQLHPLVRMARESIEQDAGLTPAVSVRVAREKVGPDAPDGVYLVAVSRWSFRGLQTAVRLAYAGSRLGGEDGKIIAPDVAERIASAAVGHGEEWLEARNTVDLKAAAEEAEALFDELWMRFDEHKDRVSARNEDRADIQQRNLREDRVRRRRTLKDTLARHRAFGRKALVKATEGQIRALENRVAQAERRIDKRRRLVPECDEVALAIVKVQSG